MIIESIASAAAMAAGAATTALQNPPPVAGMGAIIKVDPERISALAGPVEVAIGIAVAYLGFDRFRYQKRIHSLAQRLSKEVAKPSDVLATALKDGKINTDEKNLLILYYYGDGKLKDELAQHQDKLKGDFWNGWCRILMWILLDAKMDRKAVQTMMIVLCAAEIFFAFILHTPGELPAYLMSTVFGWCYFALIVAAFAVPGLSFVLSEDMTRRAERAVEDWKKSIVVNLDREAAKAALDNGDHGNGGPNG